MLHELPPGSDKGSDRNPGRRGLTCAAAECEASAHKHSSARNATLGVALAPRGTYKLKVEEDAPC